ncbi:hypothetical protein A3709_18925 [Halioglobus sp. HI00S01]|nr:hypothetical protein A3709_18925 [Halioglobus sp. HI00S01]
MQPFAVGSEPSEAPIDALEVMSGLVGSDDIGQMIDFAYAERDWDTAQRLALANRGRALRAALLQEEGGCFNVRQLSDQIGVSASGIRGQEKAGRVFSVTDNGQRLYPRWQFSDENIPYPVIAQMLSQYKPENLFKMVSFFLRDHEALAEDVRPIDLLRAGNDEDLLDLWRYEAEMDG